MERSICIPMPETRHRTELQALSVDLSGLAIIFDQAKRLSNPRGL